MWGLIEEIVGRRSWIWLLPMQLAKSHLLSHIFGSLILFIEEKIAQCTISTGANPMFEPFIIFCDKDCNLTSLTLPHSIPKKPQEHYQEHYIKSDLSTHRNEKQVLQIRMRQVWKFGDWNYREILNG